MNIADVKAALARAHAEIKGEEIRAMSNQERKLHQLAKQLLLLERDLQAPGARHSSDERVERILDAISKESF